MLRVAHRVLVSSRPPRPPRPGCFCITRQPWPLRAYSVSGTPTLSDPPHSASPTSAVPAVPAVSAEPPPIASAPTNPPTITLREYQEECIQAVLSYLAAGHKRLGISLATGAGKTVIFTHLIDRIAATGAARNTLILAHRRELVQQAARHCALAYPDKHVDIEMGNNNASGTADITIASIQSITSGTRLSKFDPACYKLILIDEAHHMVSQTYLDVLDHFGLRHSPAPDAPALVGVSATLSRFDGRSLGAVIDHIVYHRDYVDMIDENWLSDVIFTTVQMSADLNKIGSGANGDFQTAALSSAVNTEETNELVIKSWMTKAQGRRSTLIFCVDLSHVTNLTAKFREYGIDAQFVTGDTPPKVRTARIDEFRNGSFPVLLNCGVFTEGTDIPNIDCVLLARPTKSRNLLVQMIGRGMRLHKGKDNCHIIDMVAALSTGVVSTPTLFGLDPGEILQNTDSKAMHLLKEEKEKERRKHEKEQEEQAMVLQQRTAGKPSGAITFTDYDSLHDLIADTLNDKFVRSLSPYAWVSVGNDKYILSTNSGNYIAIEPHDTQEGFRAKYYMKLAGNTKYPYAAPRTIATGETLEHVVHAADTYAAEVFQHIWIAKNVPWRRSPASKAQIDFLNRSRPQEKQLKPGELLKGKAGDMITRLKYGVKGRFEKATTKQRGEQRSKDRAQTLQQRLQGHVHVGPLGGV